MQRSRCYYLYFTLLSNVCKIHLHSTCYILHHPLTVACCLLKIQKYATLFGSNLNQSPSEILCLKSTLMFEAIISQSKVNFL